MSKVGESKSPIIATAAAIAAAVITALTVTTMSATSVNTTNLKATGLATYANDTLAKAGGLVAGQFYKTATGGVQVTLAAS